MSKVETGGGQEEGARVDGNGSAERAKEELVREFRDLDEYARDLPPGYLSILRDSVPYYLRVASLKQDGVPDMVIDTAEARSLPYLAPGSVGREQLGASIRYVLGIEEADGETGT